MVGFNQIRIVQHNNIILKWWNMFFFILYIYIWNITLRCSEKSITLYRIFWGFFYFCLQKIVKDEKCYYFIVRRQTANTSNIKLFSIGQLLFRMKYCFVSIVFVYVILYNTYKSFGFAYRWLTLRQDFGSKFDLKPC